MQGWSLGQNGAGFTGAHSEEAREKMRENSNKGWVWMTRGDERCVVPPEQVPEKSADGWEFGMGPSDFVYMTSPGGGCKRVRPSRVPEEVAKGWALGKPSWGSHSDEFREKMSKRTKGSRWVNNPDTGKRKRVPPEALRELLSQGWVLGKGSQKS